MLRAADTGPALLSHDSANLLQVTAKPSNMREDSELTPVLRVLQKVEFTAALETTVLRQLARFVMYESYPGADHMVVKQGDPGALFYIILAGVATSGSFCFYLEIAHRYVALPALLSACNVCTVMR